MPSKKPNDAAVQARVKMSQLHIFLSGGLAILVYVSLVWLISLAKKDAGIMDIFWGPGFILAAYTYLMVNPETTLQVSLLFGLILLWGVRLALHIGLRNAGMPEDARYANWRQQFGTRWWWYSYLRVFILQGAVMWIVSLPLLTGLQDQSDLHVVDYVGLLLFLAGFLFEAIGDWQLRQFKKDSKNRGKVMNTGLWGLTRHPNYFGEAVLWWGLTLIAIEISTLWILISPLIMTWLLIKVSGVKMLDELLIKTKPGYAEYIRTTNAFIPGGQR
jgi:steroid 5-alpha reductase family enzyme